jgi:putative NADH-flavin reductase
MRILVFGAVGRTGRLVVDQALARGHDVTAFVRDPSRVESGRERLRVVRGDATDPATVAGALAAQAAVVSALGTGKSDDVTGLFEATRTVVEAMERIGPRRLALISNVGVLLKKVDHRYEAVVTQHRRNLDLMRASALDWVAAAPPGLTDEQGAGVYQAVLEARPPSWTIPRADLATFLLDAVERDEWVGHTVGVSS